MQDTFSEMEMNNKTTLTILSILMKKNEIIKKI